MVTLGKKRYCYAVSLIVGIGLALLVYKHTPLIHQFFSTQSDQLPNAVSPEVYQQFQQELTEHEQGVWDILQTDTHITKEECLKKQKEKRTEYEKSLEKNWKYHQLNYPKLKSETIALIQSVLHDFNINPASITIVPRKGNGSSAAADDGTLFIDEDSFTLLSPEARRFCIAHEISHIQAQDHSFYGSLCAVAQTKKGVSPTKKKNALNAFNRFYETRADIQALLHGGKKYSKGAFEFLHKVQELQEGDNPGITHPKTSSRIKTVEKLCSMMGWNNEKLMSVKGDRTC